MTYRNALPCAPVPACPRRGDSRRALIPTRKYAIGELGFEWRWLRQWSLIGSLQLPVAGVRRRTFGRQTPAPFLIGIVYEPKRAQ